MELPILYRRVIALDIHQSQITACALIMDEDGSSRQESRQFGTFKRNLREMVQWVLEVGPQVVIMESTGIYWKSPYAALEKAGICAIVVNARHVKKVPGRKTDVSDAQWLALLGRAGLLRSSFVPPEKLRELRVISRHRQKLVGSLASAKNRLHKVLTDCGVRLGTIVSDIHGKEARSIIKALIAGKPDMTTVISLCKRLKADREDLLESIQGDISHSHRFVLEDLMNEIESLEARISGYDARLLGELEKEMPALRLLQSIPGIDITGAAMLLVETGTDMDEFGCASHLASWAGVCPGNNESGGKRKSGRTTKGNVYVKRLLCEFAHAASRTASVFQVKYKALILRRGYKRTIIAIAHKLLRTIFFMLKNGEFYRDSTVDLEELMTKRNKPRWLKMLKKYGGLPKEVPHTELKPAKV